MALDRILVRLPGPKLGDFLMTTPALAALRHTHPGARITLLPWPGQSDAWLERSPLFDALLRDEVKGRHAGPAGALRLLADIRVARFDAAVTLHSGSRYAWLFRLTGIPLRVGSTGKYYGRLFTHNLRQERGMPDRHEVEYNCEMMAPLGVTVAPGAMRYPVGGDEAAAAGRLLEGAIGSGGRYIVLNPTHGGSSRRWPADRFAAAAKEIAAHTGTRIVVTGAAADAAENARMAETLGPNAVDLTGRTTVGTLGAVLRGAALHLSIDTGTAHLAAAMGTPCVTVFPFFEHWDQRVRWQPWRTETRLIGPSVRCPSCRPGACSRQESLCVDSIRAVEVIAAALDLLSESRASL